MFSSRIIEDISVWAKFVALVIGVPAAIIGLFKAVFEIRANREQRATELRWKQANTAKELLNDIHEHGLEKHAIHMLDWCEGKAEYEIAPGTSETLVADLCARSLAIFPVGGFFWRTACMDSRVMSWGSTLTRSKTFDSGLKSLRSWLCSLSADASDTKQ